MSTILTLIVSMAVTGAPGGNTANRKLIDRVAAVVNEEVITQSELAAAVTPYVDNTTTPERRRAVTATALDTLIQEKLLEQQIREAQVHVSAEDVERAIDDICRQNGLTREHPSRRRARSFR